MQDMQDIPNITIARLPDLLTSDELIKDKEYVEYLIFKKIDVNSYFYDAEETNFENPLIKDRIIGVINVQNNNDIKKYVVLELGKYDFQDDKTARHFIYLKKNKDTMYIQTPNKIKVGYQLLEDWKEELKNHLKKVDSPKKSSLTPRKSANRNIRRTRSLSLPSSKTRKSRSPHLAYTRSLSPWSRSHHTNKKRRSKPNHRISAYKIPDLPKRLSQSNKVDTTSQSKPVSSAKNDNHSKAEQKGKTSSIYDYKSEKKRNTPNRYDSKAQSKAVAENKTPYEKQLQADAKDQVKTNKVYVNNHKIFVNYFPKYIRQDVYNILDPDHIVNGVKFPDAYEFQEPNFKPKGYYPKEKYTIMKETEYQKLEPFISDTKFNYNGKYKDSYENEVYFKYAYVHYPDGFPYDLFDTGKDFYSVPTKTSPGFYLLKYDKYKDPFDYTKSKHENR